MSTCTVWSAMHMILKGAGSSEIPRVCRNGLKLNTRLISHRPIIFKPRGEVLALTDIKGLEFMTPFSNSLDPYPGDSNAAPY